MLSRVHSLFGESEMKVHRFEEASEFYQQVKDYLLSDEAQHCLLLSIVNTLIFYPGRYNCNPYLATVETNGNIVAVAMRTPPRKLLLSKIQDFAAVEAIAQDLHDDRQQLPGVNSLPEQAKAFTQAWLALTGKTSELSMQLRIHQLDKVQPIARCNGYLRHATQDDFDLLLDWYKAFSVEAFGAVEGNEERSVKRHLSQKNLYLWQDKTPVSIVCGRVSTPNGSSIGLVYTPPEYRRKGYATSCVAALSQILLDRVCRYCFLFTDMSNPTSNHIYRIIGYQPMCDWHDYSFTEDTTDATA